MFKKLMQSSNHTTQQDDTPKTHSDMNRITTAIPATPAPAPTLETPAATPKAAPPQEEGNKLIVGPNIKLKGSEITDCEILVVEGRVEASMKSRHIRVAEGGVFCGKAEIDVAEIRGHFEGELIARKRLVIYATGKVTGQIHYGSMTVEEGGIISGTIESITPESVSPKAPELVTITPAEPAPSTVTRPGTVTRLGQAYPSHLLSKHMASKRQA